MYFDGNGNVINADIEKVVTTTVLGSDVSETDYIDLKVSQTYLTKMKEAIVAWGSEYAGDAEKIPFIVHTDQHGRLTSARKGIFDAISYIVNWDEVSAIFNLGDTVVDHWEDDDTNTNPLLRNGTLENALVCLENIPLDKQINVFGNHDTWYSGDEQTTVAGVLPSLKYLNPYFKTNGLRTVRNPDNGGLMCVYDDKNKIKYLIVADWDYADKTSGTVGYLYYWLNKDHWEWVIKEMEKNEGYSLVIVSHIPLLMYSENAIDPITNTSIAGTITRLIPYWEEYDAVWSARKAKTSGSITVDGATIPYDFTECTDDLLCALAGHTHCDGVDRIGDLLQVAFDWFDQDTIHFGLIDRREGKIKVWKLGNPSNTPKVENWSALLTNS